jgi:hypothetical protein
MQEFSSSREREHSRLVFEMHHQSRSGMGSSTMGGGLGLARIGDADFAGADDASGGRFGIFGGGAILMVDDATGGAMGPREVDT